MHGLLTQVVLSQGADQHPKFYFKIQDQNRSFWLSCYTKIDWFYLFNKNDIKERIILSMCLCVNIYTEDAVIPLKRRHDV